MSLDRFVELYLDYINNFLTVEAFASHHGIGPYTAEEIIRLGRAISQLPNTI